MRVPLDMKEETFAAGRGVIYRTAGNAKAGIMLPWDVVIGKVSTSVIMSTPRESISLITTQRLPKFCGHTCSLREPD